MVLLKYNKKQLIKHIFLTSNWLIITLFLGIKQISANSTKGIWGTISVPQGVSDYNSGGNIGLIVFISNIYKLATVGAGIWSFINIIMAGYIYITSAGDTGAHQKVVNKIMMTAIGLAIIVTAYTITALISLILFGDAGYILNPTLSGA